MAEEKKEKKKKLEFRDIVLEHLKRILEITSVEFRGGYWNETGSNPVVRTYVPDSRRQYIQTIESFSDILLPFFDAEMKKKDKEYETKWRASYKILLAKKEKSDDDIARENMKYVNKKLDLARELFRALNLFCHRLKLFEDGKK